MLQFEVAGHRPWAEAPRPCRVASWQDRYIFAERDARRIAITREELCWDSPCLEEGSSWSAPRSMRRWAVALHFDRSFDLEAFFHDDGKFMDTGRFQAVSAPWHFVYTA